MGIQEAVARCFSKYVEFQGRAARPEYWYWVLFVIVTGIILRIVGAVIFGLASGAGNVLHGLFDLATFLPGLAVAVRRLHDTDRTGWWLLIAFVPILMCFIPLLLGGGAFWLILIILVGLGCVGTLLYFMVQPGTRGPNQYGDGTATS
jgi:uncharacterized membrane protein YhaH (DUF805 family)